MNFANKIYKKFAGTILLCSLCLAGVVSQSCTEDIDQASRYTFTGETIVDYLENRSDSFSDFLTILRRAKVKAGSSASEDGKGSIKHLLATYGRYTCFAPTDSAVRRFVRQQFEIWYNDSVAVAKGELPADEARITGITSPEFDELSDSMCAAIAKDHIIEGDIYHTYDLGEGALGRPNMNDRYIASRFVADENTGIVSLKLNDASTCISQDNDAENGVVHVLDKVLNPSNELAPDLLKSYEEHFSIFSELIFETGLEKILRQTSFNMDSLEIAMGWKYGDKEPRLFAPTSAWDGLAKIPETHYIKFTILAVPDVVLDSLYGVKTIDDLLVLAEKWYSNSNYVKGETPITDPNHPLYRLIAYHIVERELLYSGGFVHDNIKFPDGFDSEKKYAPGVDRYEYYETLLDNGKLLKVTKPYSATQNLDDRGSLEGEIVLNYSQEKGAKCVNPELADHINVRVLNVDDFRALIQAPDTFEFRQSGHNAMLHPLDRLLIYNSDEMKGNILNERIRMNFMSFFPELTNNRIRWSYATENNSWCYYLIPDGYCKRVKFNSNGSKMYYLYSHDGSTAGWCDYQGDEIITSGTYDFEYRIPHVPAGTYELRLGTCLYSLRGIAQTYMDGKVAGLPIDLRTEATSDLVAERYDWKDDDDQNTLKGDPELIAADDKARRARGYMKGPASALVSGGSKTLRQAENAARIILGTFTLGEGDHWIRFKNTEESTSTEFMHNYLELVPKSILSDPSKPEDKN